MFSEKPTSPLPLRRKFNSIASDEEPLYDAVASDEDYSSIDNLSLNNNSRMKQGVSVKIIEWNKVQVLTVIEWNKV